MALRTVTIPDPTTISEACKKNRPKYVKWESITCKLVTPMYGGGVKSATPDIHQPVRASAIRGQLRFWWRLLAKSKWQEWYKDEDWSQDKNISDEDLSKKLRQKEFELWGGMNDGDEDGKASKVFLRIKNVKFNDKNTWNENDATISYTEEYTYGQSPLNYILFPARDTNIKLFKPGLTWTLEWRLNRKANLFCSKKEYKNISKQVKQTLRWWVNFGGLGARTRRGCGAFEVTESSIASISKSLTKPEVNNVGFQLEYISFEDEIIRKEIKKFTKKNEKPYFKFIEIESVNQNNAALAAWELAALRMREFRQGIDVGRNQSNSGKPAGRSRWPEPDSIRDIAKCHYVEVDYETMKKKDGGKNHEPEHQAKGGQFPRGMFGMPIIFHFTNPHKDDYKEQIDKKTNKKVINKVMDNIPPEFKEPSTCTLLPKDKERMSSPIIIRPFKNRDGQWVAAALLLPYDANLSVKLKGVPENKSQVTLSNAETANQIQPIKDNGGGDPLTAFMAYFANK